jgi:Na+-driven multidrug efflux pump
VLWIAWPLIPSFWMRSLFTFVDAYFARSIGDEAVAAIGLAWPLEFLMIALWVGASTGMTSLLSRAMGAHEGRKIEQVIATTRRIVRVLIPVYGLVGVAAWIVAPHLARTEPGGPGLDPEVARHFQVYASVIVIGSSVTSFWSILPDSIVKAHHDTRSTMWAGITSNLLNVALNALFLYVFHWGMFGIAFSTVLGRLGGLAYALRAASRHERRRLLAGLDTVPGTHASPLREMLALGVPAAITYGLVGLEPVAVNALLARTAQATESIAAFAVYSRHVLFFNMPLIATAVAILPWVARLRGQGDVRGIRRAFRDVGVAGAIYALLFVAPVTLLWNEALVRPFTERPETRELAAWGVRLCAAAALCAIPFFTCRPIFEGLQRGGPGLVVAGVRYVGLTVPACLLGAWLAAAMGRPALHGVLPGLIVASAAASALLLAWMLRALRGLEEKGV